MDGLARRGPTVFERWMRMGDLPGQSRVREMKFNPNHDPANGRFTSGTGGGGGVAGGSAAGRADARRTDQAAAKPGRGSDLGGLAQGEEASGKDDAGTVSSGRDDPGGISYGSYQFASKPGTADAFVASPDASRWAADFAGLKAGTPAFSAAWRAVAARDPEAFKEAQFAFIRRRNYDPVVASVARATGYDLDGASEAVRQATYSTAVQHGGARAILDGAIRQTDRSFDRADPAYQAALIDAIYDRRIAYVARIRDKLVEEGKSRKAKYFTNIMMLRLPKERVRAKDIIK